MKTSSTILLALFAIAGSGIASAQRAPSGPADLRAATAGKLQPLSIAAAAGCDAATPGIIIHDDGEAENGYGFSADQVDKGGMVDKFTPAQYPATFKTVCIAFITNAGQTTLPFSITAYALDGAGGSPGTRLGTVSAVGHPVPVSSVPVTPTFESFDISSMALNIGSDSVYLGVEWDVNASVSNVFVAGDESPSTPPAGGWFWANNFVFPGTDQWGPTYNEFPGYRSLMFRAVESVAQPSAPLATKSFDPVMVMSNVPSTLTITLNNRSQPTTAAVLTSNFTDTFPAGLVIAATPNASTTCASGSVVANPGSGSVTLASGAQIPAAGTCTISVNVSSPTDSVYVNTIAAGSLVTNFGSNPYAASARLQVGYVFPEPYCPIAFSERVAPISNVNFAGINNTSSAVVNGTPAMQDFTAILGNVGVGQTYPISVQGNTTGNYDAITVFVDWNHDGDFDDAGETYQIGRLNTSTGTDGVKATGNIAVPLDAVPGQTRMRVVKHIFTPGVACGDNETGQSEDYTLTVTGLGPEPSLSKRFVPAQVEVDASSTLTLMLDNTRDNQLATLTSALVDAFPAGLVVADPPNASTTCGNATIAVLPGDTSVTLPAGATIAANGSCQVTVATRSATLGQYNNVIAAGALKTDQGNSPLPATASVKFGFTFPEPYCPINFSQTVQPITLVNFAGINNRSSPVIGGSPASENFTSIVGTVAAGDVLPMAVEGNTADWFFQPVTAYIDWNHDGDFNDPGETYAIGVIEQSTGTDGVQVIADIAVPADALPGPTRMRVTKKYNVAAAPCNTDGLGQAEDYTLQVTAGIADAIFCDGFELGGQGACAAKPTAIFIH